VHELQIAWLLAELASHDLDDVEQNHVYIALGAGDVITAIALLLQAIVNAQRVLGADLIAALRRWLKAYQGHPFEPPIRQLVGTAETIAVAAIGSGTPRLSAPIRPQPERENHDAVGDGPV
jgi:hypothetical protein